MTALVTVGLPAWRAGEIAWLPMEGLSRQTDAPPWELLIAEEQTSESFGKWDDYRDRLAAAGCVRVEWYAPQGHEPLVHKWLTIAEASAPTSRLMLLQGADDYPGPRRIADSWDAYEQTGAAWVQWSRGYFYDVASASMSLFDLKTPGYGAQVGGDRHTGVSMGVALDIARQIKAPQDPPRRGVDGWLLARVARACGYRAPIAEVQSDDWKRAVYTDGFNALSLNRGAMCRDSWGPFSATTAVLRDVVPAEVADRLDVLRARARLVRAQRQIEQLRDVVSDNARTLESLLAAVGEDLEEIE